MTCENMCWAISFFSTLLVFLARACTWSYISIRLRMFAPNVGAIVIHCCVASMVVFHILCSHVHGSHGGRTRLGLRSLASLACSSCLLCVAMSGGSLAVRAEVQHGCPKGMFVALCWFLDYEYCPEWLFFICLGLIFCARYLVKVS